MVPTINREGLDLMSAEKQLSLRDASVLNAILQARELDVSIRKNFLLNSASEEGQKVGLFILDPANHPLDRSLWASFETFRRSVNGLAKFLPSLPDEPTSVEPPQAEGFEAQPKA